jgi:hypothetical protein
MSQIRNKCVAPLDSDFRDRATALFLLLAEVRPHCSEDIWLGGGLLRDTLIGSPRRECSDVDLLFFNDKETSKTYEVEIEAKLIELTKIRNLSVKNQARMGALVDGARYESLTQSIVAFPDTTIAAAACLHSMKEKTLLIFAPYGLPSLSRRFIRPTSRYLASHGRAAYYGWLDRKKYEQRFQNWTIDTVGCRPVPFTSAFLELPTI